MKLLNLKKSPFQIEINFNFYEFMPDVDIDENSILSGSFFLSVKNQFTYLTKFHYSRAVLDFTRHPTMKIQSDDENCMNYIYGILDKVNNNSEKIINNILEQRQYIAFDDLKNQFDQYIAEQIRSTTKEQKIQFLQVGKIPNGINVEFDLKELSHLNVIQSLDFINSARIALKQQFENYNKSYCPHESINIEAEPHFIITGASKETLDYFEQILKRINNQSNYLYEEVVINDRMELKEFFTSFLNGFIAQEILKDQLPTTSTVNKKKNKI
jgi:hypothetical protein